MYLCNNSNEHARLCREILTYRNVKHFHNFAFIFSTAANTLSDEITYSISNGSMPLLLANICAASSEKLPFPPLTPINNKLNFPTQTLNNYYFLSNSSLTALPISAIVYGFLIYPPTPNFNASFTRSVSANPLSIIAF